MNEQKMTVEQVGAGIKAGFGDVIAEMKNRNMPQPTKTDKYVVPEGMLKAAQMAALGGEFPIMEFIRRGVEAAIRWQSENPIVITPKEATEIANRVGDPRVTGVGVANGAMEWQRRMYRAPEPVVPEEINDLLWSSVPDNNGDRGSTTVEQSEFRILEAYRRGQLWK